MDHNESTVSADGRSAEGGSDPQGELLPAGTELGRYTLVGLIGQGGMGAVYEAVHRDLKKRVAIKTLHRRLAGSAEVRARFVREGQAASKIRHEHVVDVTDVGVEGDVPYLVMEFLEGESLASLLIREGRLSPQRAADLLVPVTDALAAAHASGIVHRDLKPENVFLAGSAVNPKPKVLDFGISKVVDTATANANQLTGTSAMLGTPFYMSPEQAQDAKGIDARTDQYSLGVILYEAVTGQRPFGNQALYSLLTKIVEGRFEPPRALLSDLSEEFERLILRAMAKDAADRFESISALGKGLLDFASDRTRMLYADALGSSAAALAPARPQSGGPSARSPLQSSYAGATSTVGSSREPGRNVKWMFLAGLGAGVVVATGVALSGRHEEASPVTAAAPTPPPQAATVAPEPVVAAAAPSAELVPSVVPVSSAAEVTAAATPSASATARPRTHTATPRPRVGPPKLAPR